jgi:hypothetical protein
MHGTHNCWLVLLSADPGRLRRPGDPVSLLIAIMAAGFSLFVASRDTLSRVVCYGQVC